MPDTRELPSIPENVSVVVFFLFLCEAKSILKTSMLLWITLASTLLWSFRAAKTDKFGSAAGPEKSLAPRSFSRQNQ